MLKRESHLSAIASLDAGAPDVLGQAIELARTTLGMDMAYVADVRDGLQTYVAVAGDGDSFGVTAGAAIPLPGTYCELLAAGDAAFDGLVLDSLQDARVADLLITYRACIGAYIGVPLRSSSGRVFGTFCCLSHAARPTLGERDQEFMKVIALLIAGQLERDRLHAAVRRAEATAGKVEALIAALAARDGYSGTHSDEVAGLALVVGARLGLPPEALARLRHVALLHDIGKLGIPDAILMKPGPLDTDEWDLMREHPAIGADIVGSMPTLAHLAPALRHEHERWDGGGYPDGLAGDQIPVESRIVLACDAWHAMTSDRPYRRALGLRRALQELDRHAGTQFDPEIATTLKQVLGSAPLPA